MAGITIDDLLGFSQQWPDTVDSWEQLLAAVESNVSYLRDTANQPLSSTWQGTAAELASGQIDTTHGGLITTASQLRQVTQSLQNFSTQLASYSKQINSLVGDAQQQGFTVAQDGSVTFPDGSALAALHQSLSASNTAVLQQESQRLEKQRQTMESEIQALLAKANSLDDQTASDLQRVLPSQSEQQVTTTPWNSKDSSLWQIAQQEYGDGNKWQVIYDANRDVIGPNPNLIPVGVKLNIPVIQGTPSAAQTTAALSGAASAAAPATTGLVSSIGLAAAPGSGAAAAGGSVSVTPQGG